MREIQHSWTLKIVGTVAVKISYVSSLFLFWFWTSVIKYFCFVSFLLSYEDVFYRPQVTYTPRLIAIDLKGTGDVK